MKTKWILFFLLICLYAFGEEPADDGLAPLQFSITDFTFYGIGARLVYNGMPLFKDLNTGLLVELGGGYFDGSYFQNPDASAYIPPYDSTPDLSVYKKMQLSGGLGIVQGLQTAANHTNNYELFLLYRCLYQQHFQAAEEASALFYASALYEKSAFLDNEIVAGVGVNYVTENTQYRTKKGFKLETSLLWGLPTFPGQALEAFYYYQIASKLWFYWPLIANDYIALSVADRALLELTDGTYVPLLARQRFAGMDADAALGGAVRGLSAGRYNGYFQFANNCEVRLSFPSLIGYGWIPGILAFYDNGASDNLVDDYVFNITAATTGVGITLQNPLLDLALNFCYHIDEARFPVIVFFTGYHF